MEHFTSSYPNFAKGEWGMQKKVKNSISLLLQKKIFGLSFLMRLTSNTAFLASPFLPFLAYFPPTFSSSCIFKTKDSERFWPTEKTLFTCTFTFTFAFPFVWMSSEYLVVPCPKPFVGWPFSSKTLGASVVNLDLWSASSYDIFTSLSTNLWVYSMTTSSDGFYICFPFYFPW